MDDVLSRIQGLQSAVQAALQQGDTPDGIWNRASQSNPRGLPRTIGIIHAETVAVRPKEWQRLHELE